MSYKDYDFTPEKMVKLIRNCDNYCYNCNKCPLEKDDDCIRTLLLCSAEMIDDINEKLLKIMEHTNEALEKLLSLKNSNDDE